MKRIFFITVLLISSFCNGQGIINPYVFTSITTIDITFPGLTVFSSSPLVYSQPSNNDIATESLAASTDGMFYFKVNTGDGSTVIGLDRTGSANFYTLWDYGVYVSTNYHKVYLDGSNHDDDTGIAWVSGDLVGMRRTGSSVTLEYYRSGAWNVISTYSVTTTAQLYAKAQMSTYLREPKGVNIH